MMKSSLGIRAERSTPMQAAAHDAASRMRVAYARVPPREQNPDPQLRGLNPDGLHPDGGR